jgi:hypothetical protein
MQGTIHIWLLNADKYKYVLSTIITFPVQCNAIFTHCNSHAKKCPQKPIIDGHRFDFFSIIPIVYDSFEHIMLQSSIIFNENVQKFVPKVAILNQIG